MILVTHPRSGSEWFFDCLQDSKFVRWEIFGDLGRATDNQLKMPQLSVNAKMSMVKSNPPSKSHKFMLYRFWGDVEPSHPLVDHMMSRNDVVLLRRRNTRAAIISMMVAANNGLNFHYDPKLLTKSFKIEKDRIEVWAYRMHWIFEDPKLALKYSEALWYEDLLAGQKPQTVKFDGTASLRPIRNSSKLNLVTNIDQVDGWFNELGVPGSL